MDFRGKSLTALLCPRECRSRPPLRSAAHTHARPRPAKPQEGCATPLSVKWADPELQLKKRRAVEESNTDNRMVRGLVWQKRVAGDMQGAQVLRGGSRHARHSIHLGCPSDVSAYDAFYLAIECPHPAGPRLNPNRNPPPHPLPSCFSPRCCAAPATKRCGRCLGATAACSRSTCSGHSRWAPLHAAWRRCARGCVRLRHPHFVAAVGRALRWRRAHALGCRMPHPTGTARTPTTALSSLHACAIKTGGPHLQGLWPCDHGFKRGGGCRN
jgi:hypothetical protein